MREGRAGQNRDRCIRTNLASNFVDQLTAAFFDALGTEDESDGRARRPFQYSSQMLRRRNHQPGIAAGEVGNLAGCRNRGIESNAGQEHGNFVRAVDRGDLYRLACPEQRFPAAARHDLRERGSPRAAADHADPVKAHAFTPAPRTFSAVSSSGHRARAGASSLSHNPAANRSAPAQAIIAALSVQSQAGGTLKRRPCWSARPASAPRLAPLAATPPAITRVGASLRGNAIRVRSTKQSTTACWKLAAMSSGRWSPDTTAR